MITVALDRDPEDVRPYIERAEPAHPSLIDTEHRLAELYNIENVPTGVWIDEQGRIVRPNDVTYGSNALKFITGIDAEKHREAVRAWVHEEAEAHLYDPEEAREHLRTPSREQQLARAEFRLGQWLHEAGREERARDHFDRAVELAPDDVAVRRGSMRMRDENPMGWAYLKMVIERLWKGIPYYNPLPDLRGG